ncbi:lipase/acyltransferase domain-containing protein [Streptomyces sp. NPDC001709]
MAKKSLRDLIVVLPGITGSVLRADGRDVWALSMQALWSWGATGGESLQRLRLRDGDPGEVVAQRLMPTAHLIPGLVKIDGYSILVRLVRETFEIVPGANFIEFPYDWRLDNRVAARKLAQTVERALHEWRRRTDNPAAKVVFLAHSMGGLVARYYLEALEGWRNCRALVTFGTPYRGSLNALDFLANGYKKAFVNLTDVMRSFPAVHQLLPIYRALRVGDEYVRVAEAGGLPGIDPLLAADALAFHREIETKVTEHRDDDEYRHEGYTIVPIIGTRQPTNQSGVLTDGRVTVGRDLPTWIDAQLADGDGTVPRASAIPIELTDAYRDTFVPERHGSLQCNAAILADVRGRLEQSQVRGLGTIRGPKESPTAADRPAIALDVEDLYLPTEPVTIRTELINTTPALPLRARVEPLEPPTASAPRIVEMAPRPGCAKLELAGLSPGLYRVTVEATQAGPAAPGPVHDIFAVAGPGDEPG